MFPSFLSIKQSINWTFIFYFPMDLIMDDNPRKKKEFNYEDLSGNTDLFTNKGKIESESHGGKGCDKINEGPNFTSTPKMANGTYKSIPHPLDEKEVSLSLESLEAELPAFSSGSSESKVLNSSDLLKTSESSSCTMNREIDSGSVNLSEDEEEDHSLFQAVLSPDCQDVRLRKEVPKTLDFPIKKRVRINPELLAESLNDDIAYLSDEELDQFLSPSLESPDDVEDSILEKLGESSPEMIPEYTAEEEREELRSWQSCTVNGVERRIDMKVIEPYKRVLSHGGYLNAGSHNAIIVFSACFLPHRSRVDYSYVTDNLFFYVLSTLDQLITDDYVLVYLHGGTAKDCMPTFSWLKRCYQMIDRKLRKNLKKLYLVHPTFWLKTIVLMTKPFVSSKFSRKIEFINSLTDLHNVLPLEQASIPERVRQYDRLKQSIEPSK